MTRESIQVTLSELLAEDANLKTQAELIQRRRTQISAAIVSLTALENDQMPEFSGGLAEAIRTVLRADTKMTFSATDVRTGLKILKFNFDNMSNPLASIHSVLRRLHESGEVYANAAEGDASARYQWVERGTIGDIMRGAPGKTHPDILKTFEILAKNTTHAIEAEKIRNALRNKLKGDK
jgi:hypothetical protein